MPAERKKLLFHLASLMGHTLTNTQRIKLQSYESGYSNNNEILICSCEKPVDSLETDNTQSFFSVFSSSAGSTWTSFKINRDFMVVHSE